MGNKIYKFYKFCSSDKIYKIYELCSGNKNYHFKKFVLQIKFINFINFVWVTKIITNEIYVFDSNMLQTFTNFFQIPCISSEASKWMQDTNAEFQMGGNTRNGLLIPQRMTQQ